MQAKRERIGCRQKKDWRYAPRTGIAACSRRQRTDFHSGVTRPFSARTHFLVELRVFLTTKWPPKTMAREPFTDIESNQACSSAFNKTVCPEKTALETRMAATSQLSSVEPCTRPVKESDSIESAESPSESTRIHHTSNEQELEQRVAKYRQLQASQVQLEAFTHSVSHDLRARSQCWVS